MPTNKLLSPRAARIISLMLLIVCACMLYRHAALCVSILKGHVEVQLEGGERAFLCGEELSAWITLPETIHLGEAADSAVYAGVCAMGLNRMLPLMAVYAMLSVLLFNGARGRLISGQSARLLMICGGVVALAAVLVPLINFCVIPAMLSPREIGVSLDISKGPHIWQGMALMLAAYAVGRGANANAADKA